MLKWLYYPVGSPITRLYRHDEDEAVCTLQSLVIWSFDVCPNIQLNKKNGLADKLDTLSLAMNYWTIACYDYVILSQIPKFMGPTWGPPGSCRPQIGPMLAPWTLLSGFLMSSANKQEWPYIYAQQENNLSQ